MKGVKELLCAMKVSFGAVVTDEIIARSYIVVGSYKFITPQSLTIESDPTQKACTNTMINCGHVVPAR